MNSFFVRWASVFVAVLLFTTGCKSTRNTGETTRKAGNKKTNLIVEEIQKNERNRPHSLSFKAATEMKSGGKTTTFKASVRMVADSAIWMSISAYGYEVARILATPDSVKYFSRTDKKYYIGNYGFIGEKIGVELDFYDMQSLILAHSFGLDSLEHITRRNAKNSYVLSSVKKGKLKKMEKRGIFDDEFEVVFTNWINPENYRVERVEMTNLNTGNKASIQYSAFENIGGYTLLSAFQMDIIAEKNSEISSTFSKISVNEPLKFPFKISSKYERIE